MAKNTRNELTDVYNLNDPSHSRKTSDLLPAYLQTDKNIKFLSSTLDRLVEVPRVERISGYVGSKITPTYNPLKDQYISSVSKLTQNYQLEPGLVVRDENNEVTHAVSYDDLINQLAYYGATTDNHDKILRPTTYSYDPKIDIDKFVNYTQYYWLEGGPDPIEITGIQNATVSEYTVTDGGATIDTFTTIDLKTISSANNSTVFIFTPNGLTPDPTVTFYRGMTYVLNVTSVHNLWIKTALSYGQADQYVGVINNGSKDGQIIITVDDLTPDVLYYVAGDDTRVAGKIVVKSMLENTELNVETDLIGKKVYRSGNDVILSNGMVIYFPDSVFPESYARKRWIVEGVGTAITLVDFDSLQNNIDLSNNLDTNFDAQNFDEYPFDDFRNAPITPDYVTINRASLDRNPWSRYNRWFHAEIIEASAAANGVPAVYPQDKRARRPIIEFQPNIKLFNFGITAKTNVHLMDTVTADTFFAVEGSAGYYVDGVLLEEGYRVIFNADEDPLVRGKTFVVKIETVNDNQIINLIEDLTSTPSVGDAVVTAEGSTYRGSSWWWDGTSWILAQQKTGLNQAPIFDLFDPNGISYSDTTHYPGNFSGTRLFGYTDGTIYDPVLKLNLKYLNVENIGDFLFTNYFNTDTFSVASATGTTIIPVSSGFLKISNKFANAWVRSATIQIPILQYQVIETVTNSIEVNSIDYAGWQTDLALDVFVNDIKKIRFVDYEIVPENQYLFVVFKTNLTILDRVLFKFYTKAIPNANGIYEPSLSLTNNPLNGPIAQLTLAEFTNQLQSISEIVPFFTGSALGPNNLRDLGDTAQYGKRLISHVTPLSFAHFFLGLKEHSIINAVKKVSDDYQNFKSTFLKAVNEITNAITPRDAVDQILSAINAGKDIMFPYGYSDMVPYGQDYVLRTYTVTDLRITTYALPSIVNLVDVNDSAVIIYINGSQLMLGIDYTIPSTDPSVTFVKKLNLGDLIEIRYYATTQGCYVPPTPSKLGIYPNFAPSKYFDTTYTTPSFVIEGHDGSIMQAYDDYRDDIILELETRIFNNTKSKSVYTPSLVDINSVLPGVYRNKDFSYTEIFKILSSEFLKWTGANGVDYRKNLTEVNDPKTWNYRTSATNPTNNLQLPGHWRGIFKYFYDTDRPHTHAWEMLGFSEQPDWWRSQYGPAPFTSGNTLLWTDLSNGVIRQGPRAGIDLNYARPNLLDILPVTENGTLLDPQSIGLAQNVIFNQTNAEWIFGDHSPAETAWRRSSSWPFAVQILLALTKPAAYASTLFDTSRIQLSVAGQTVYGVNEQLLKLSDLILYRDTIAGKIQYAAGYGVMLIEAGLQRNLNYIDKLKADLSGVDYNLIYKAEGFLDKDKLAVRIDSVDPSSVNPGVLLPAEDYTIQLNQSNPILSLSISGVIIQKNEGAYIVKGYDSLNPYFTILNPIHSFQDAKVTLGGTSENFVTWTENKFYQTGQLVSYQNSYYRTKLSHTATATFNIGNFQKLAELPTVGGITVAKAKQYETATTTVSYGSTLLTVQDVYDFLSGYGKYLETRGFVFDYFQTDLNSILDWDFSTKEFLFWTTQNWIDGSIIVLSPFAQQVKFKTIDSSGNQTVYGIVDDLTDPYYQYNLLTADGTVFPSQQFTLSREDNEFVIESLLPNTGFYFAQVNIIQKQHAIIFNNFSMFKDIVYDKETGYRQQRIKLTGFRTAEWNGGLTTPGFIYDEAVVANWQQYTDYAPGEVVQYSGKYYSAIMKVDGSTTFDFTAWWGLKSKPTPSLLPNFEYKITQFEDFYSLDIDNFDVGQQRMAQHLTGYTPRIYLDNIFDDRIAQYKFYQGYIKEKGTANSVTKLAKASLNNLQGEVEFLETWAFRIGAFGGYNSYKELQINLNEQRFVQNPQIIQFTGYATTNNDFIYRVPQSDMLIAPDDYDYSNVFPTLDTNFSEYISEIQTAGYVRVDDVTATAYNINSILDIGDPNLIAEGSTFWLGFSPTGSWDVLRYTRQNVQIIDVTVTNPGVGIQFTTAQSHGLSIGEVVAVSRFIPDLNKVYLVTSVESNTKFTVSSTLTAVPYSSEIYIGIVSKFVSVRFGSFDDLHSLPRLTTTKYGDKIWVDDDGSKKWAVYEKINNYSGTTYSDAVDNTNQQYGFSYSTDESTSTYVVSAPGFYDNNYGYGKIFVYDKTSVRDVKVNTIFTYSLKEAGHDYYLSTIPPQYGYSLKYDAADNIIFAGAPATSRVRGDATGTGDLRFVNDVNNVTLFDRSGMIKITAINRVTNSPITLAALTTPNPTSNGRYGNAIVVNSSATNKQFLVGAPGEGVGRVYNYTMTMGQYNTSTVTVSALTALSNANLPTGSFFGQSIAASDDLSIVAVGAPGAYSDTGVVRIFTKNSNNTFTALSTDITKDTVGLQGLITSGDLLGNKLVMSKDGKYLFVSSPGTQYGLYQGMVSVWKWNGSKFDWLQNLTQPNRNSNTIFGFDISIDDNKETLIVSSIGTLELQNITFDTFMGLLPNATALYGTKYVKDPGSEVRHVKTTFDNQSTRFYSNIEGAGSVSVFNRYGTYFSYAQDIQSNAITVGSDFGYSVAQLGGNIYVGAPSSDTTAGKNNGQTFIFQKIDKSVNSWSLLRHEEPLVDPSVIKRLMVIDADKDVITQYLEIFDPVKGYIPGTANQELSYKTMTDPAVYTLGTGKISVDTNTNWTDNHVGELWWDTGAVKYYWYEQGELEYRKNQWGTTFPGSAIQVYEWISSDLLPSEWAAVADTNNGLLRGISGQPKYTDNSVLSVKQVYNQVTNTFSNVYYYWVRNKTTLPTNGNRRINAITVAGLIADPKTQLVEHATILRQDAVALVNIKGLINNDSTNLHINFDRLTNSAPRHTEWLLLQEGDQYSSPSVMLEQKLIDSLVGYDKIGQPVPDPTLSVQQRYGINVRPRQTMFADRMEALRTVLEWTNTVLLENRIISLKSIPNLKMMEQIPSSEENAWDQVVETNYQLGLVETKSLSQAQLVCTINSNGGIDRVTVSYAGGGYNYLYPPTVTVAGNGHGAVIHTVLSETGQVVGATIIEPGYGYTAIPKLLVRPYTVYVQTDSEANNMWSKFEWSQAEQLWTRIHSQQYDVTKYWTLVDWTRVDYNNLQPISYTISDTYGLNGITPKIGDLVKIQNAGAGRYVVLKKVDKTIKIGTFDTDYDIIAEEKGTIQIDPALWSPSLTDFGFDEVAAYDSTFFDQAPDVELQYILKAIKDDLFTGDLKQYWNKFFFHAVKYAFSEQSNLDWAFKTAFISVKNKAGALDQRPTYKLQDSTFYENWIEEVKPYHTKIRNFTTDYTSLEPTHTFNTDFDLPAYYDETLGQFTTLKSFGDPLLNTYPYRSWADNFSYGVGEVQITDGGSNYVSAPRVEIITASGDTGSGATAVAYISLGKIYDFVVTNPGNNYTITPTVVLIGGGGKDFVQATARAQLYNGKVRTTSVTMKFDRISYGSEIADIKTTDYFVGDGETYTWLLTWVPQAEKNTIDLTIDGSMVLDDQFTIEYYSDLFTNASGVTALKKFAKLVLNFVPDKQKRLVLTYTKDIKLLSAVDRINNYYNPASGMPGKELTQLMKGMTFSGVKVDTLPFNYASGWDALPFYTSAWDSYSSESNYGVVTDPLNLAVNLSTVYQTELVSVTTELSFWSTRLAQLQSVLAQTPTLIQIPGSGVQLINNPEYQYILGQVNESQIQVNHYTAKAAELNNLIDKEEANLIPVTTPFVVPVGTSINVYVTTKNGKTTRLDPLVVPTIIGTGTTATVYIPITQFISDVPFGNSNPSLIPPASYDGRGHHPTAPLRNSAGSPFVRGAVNSYVDGIHQMRSDLPNARTVSNLVVKDAVNHGEELDPNGYSGFMYAFGQLLTHDLEFARPGTGNIDVIVPAGDTELTPGSHIPVTRNAVAPDTGTDAQHPALPMNDVTGWIDASVVYGIQYPPGVPQGPAPFQNPVNLREGGAVATTGKLLTSSNGRYAPIDPDSGMFIFGDPRGTENPDLTSMQTLFIREHNWQVGRLTQLHSDWTGEQLYQRARAIVIAEFQKITYSEWLPKVVGANVMPAYTGFKSDVDASISIEFAAAAMRFGHSIVSGAQDRVDEQGNITEALTLGEAFFLTPAQYERNGGAEGFLRKLASDISNKLDVYIIDDLRNLLDDPPAALDLAATNIQRGRDLGLPSLNQMRTALGLTPYTTFGQITSNTRVSNALQTAYTNINNIDLWIGGLAETPVAGAMVGPTFRAIMVDQFTRVRAGDSQWYENQPWTREDLDWLQGTTLSDIILRNTDIVRMQADAFVAVERADLYNGQVLTITARPEFPNNSYVTFRDQTSDGTILPGDPDALDAVISGGQLGEITLGIKPSDILLDGSAFLDANYSHAPEELLPGQVQESFAVTVFESKGQASPLIINRKYLLDNLTTTFEIGGKPASTASVLVSVGTTPLRYAVDYTVNTIANTVNIASNTWTGWLSVSGLTVGGTGLVDTQIATNVNSTFTTIVSSVALASIKDAYVTVNGQETKTFAIDAAPGYQNKKKPKGAITVYHNAIGSKQIQVWLFNAPAKAYSQVHEQVFTNVNPQNTTFFLSQVPSTALPHEPQMIVEYNKQRLIPPQVSYYVVENDQSEFTVDLNDPLLPGRIDLTNVKVYKNGKPLVPGIEFSFTPLPVKVTFPLGTIQNGDVLAIMSLVGNQYSFDDTEQFLTIQNIDNRQATDTLKVITFSNDSGAFINPTTGVSRDDTAQEGMFRKERYPANAVGRYVMSRPIFNTNYVWVEYNGLPLQNDIDYAIEDDGVTVRLREGIFQSKLDKVVIMSLNDSSYSGSHAYRMFTDLVGRTSYKRLSQANTTALAQPLLATDTVIYVTDASVLTAPNTQKNLPGIVYIAGERIEFFLVNPALNTLGQLRRGTLGTGILDGLPTGTAVIDQGPLQNIPVKEKTIVENFLGSATNSVFTLTQINLVENASYGDQVEVRVNGVIQLKPTITLSTTDINIAFDSGQTDSLGNSNISTTTSYYTVTKRIINNKSVPVVIWNNAFTVTTHISVSQRTGEIFENTPAISFINEQPAALPTDAYYPGDPVIILETGEVLTDESQVPLEGI